MTAQQKLEMLWESTSQPRGETYDEKLRRSLSQDLDFHLTANEGFCSHHFHSFPAKFPPQLPRKFLQELTRPGDVFLDPMMGSGTAVVEAFLCGCRAMGMDIDPLAVLISQVKTAPYHFSDILIQTQQIIEKARADMRMNREGLERILANDFDIASRKFIDYWFAPVTQLELLALSRSIDRIIDHDIRKFFELAFSSIIITKSGGVSLALDLGHTRPHRAKIICDANGKQLIDVLSPMNDPVKAKLFTKNLKPTFIEFEKRVKQNIRGIIRINEYERPCASVLFGNAQAIPLKDNTVDLIVTSPPYASNAIDYMRAHKFSLIWMGRTIGQLGEKRKQYIGSEGISEFQFEPIPPKTTRLVENISSLDKKKGQVLHRYYSEMTRTLKEIFRILKPGKAAIVVVGNSVMRGRDTETAGCLADIGESLGFRIPHIGIRNLNRNKRMMPAGARIDLTSQIQQRMHQEYVLGFYKPPKEERQAIQPPNCSGNRRYSGISDRPKCDYGTNGGRRDAGASGTAIGPFHRAAPNVRPVADR